MDAGSPPLPSPQDGLKNSIKDFEGDLKTRTKNHFTALCEKASVDIAHFCNHIEERIKLLNAAKMDWFKDLQRHAGPAGIRVSQMPEFRDMMPATYLRVLELRELRTGQSSPPAEPAGPNQLQPGASAGSIGHSMVPLVTPTSNDEFVRQLTVEDSSRATSPATGHPAPRTTKRRLAGSTDTHIKRAYKRRRGPEILQEAPPIRPIDADSVFGQDYVFEFPKFGPGWYVIRCDGDAGGLPHNFKLNPTKRNRATKHFGHIGTGCHGEDNLLDSIEEIIKTYGYRVTDIDEEWAETSNEKLRKETDKQAAKLKRSKIKSTKARSKNKEITGIQPPSDNGPGQPAPVADMGINFLGDPIDITATSPIPSIE